MLFKKPSLEELLGQLTVAKSNYDAQSAILDTIEQNFESARSSYYMYKHYYEAALAEYTRFGGKTYSEKEVEARHKYAIASKNYISAENRLNNQTWVVRRAERVYKKLKRLVTKKEEQNKNNQPQ